MLFRLFLLFTLLPLVELVLLVWLARETSWVVTLLAILGPGIIGAWLVRREGRRCLRLAHEQAASGQVPGGELLDGLLIVIAGVLLISPGMLTDVAGLALLLRPVRHVIRGRLTRTVRARMIRLVSAVSPSADDEDEFRDGTVVDAESNPPQT
jgi:UPF0716 protein FxsA